MPSAQSRQDDDALHPESDALAHWRAQETAPLPAAPSDRTLALAEVADDRPAPSDLPSGWWILPVVVLSGALWTLLVLSVFG